MKKYQRMSLMVVISITFLLTACGTGESTDSADKTDKSKTEKTEVVETDPMKNIGVGPITSVTLGAEIDTELAAEGEKVYQLLCTACHRVDKKFIGPSPKGIFDRRSPEWIMNMILDPEKMVAEDPVAKALLIEYNGSPMANQNLTEDQARAVLEYFRTL